VSTTSPEGPPKPPPQDLHQRDPLEISLEHGAVLHRFYTSAFNPVFYDKSLKGRLNAPDQSYGVLYAAKTPEGAFAETFLRNPGLTQLPIDLIRAKAYVRLVASEPLKFVKLAGRGLARIGATAQVTHGGLPYTIAQSWSSALHNHPANFDGIAYRARHDDEEICYAVFDRATHKIGIAKFKTNLDQDWFWEIAERYGVGLVP
jgi:hypothetical protein